MRACRNDAGFRSNNYGILNASRNSLQAADPATCGFGSFKSIQSGWPPNRDLTLVWALDAAPPVEATGTTGTPRSSAIATSRAVFSPPPITNTARHGNHRSAPFEFCPYPPPAPENNSAYSLHLTPAVVHMTVVEHETSRIVASFAYPLLADRVLDKLRCISAQ